MSGLTWLDSNEHIERVSRLDKLNEQILIGALQLGLNSKYKSGSSCKLPWAEGKFASKIWFKLDIKLIQN